MFSNAHKETAFAKADRQPLQLTMESKTLNRVDQAISQLCCRQQSLQHAIPQFAGHSAAHQRASRTQEAAYSQMDKCLQQTCHPVQNRPGCKSHFAGNKFLRAPAPKRVHHAKRICYAGMGLGFTDGLILPRSSEPKLEVPTNSYGLSTRQMAALGLTEGSIAKPLEANEVQNRCMLTFSLST